MVSVASVMFAGSSHSVAQADSPIDIGDRLELFVDDYLINEISSATRTLHYPHPQEVACAHDSPWEGSSSGYKTVFQDGDLYRMYCR